MFESEAVGGAAAVRVELLVHVPAFDPSPAAGELPQFRQAAAALELVAGGEMGGETAAAHGAAMVARHGAILSEARLQLESCGAGRDLDELLKTGRSNSRPVRWSWMTIAPNTAFPIHAHPNVEIIYVAQGTIHEDRLSGAPPPNLNLAARTEADFDRRASRKGETLANEVGSVHRSFTLEDGCSLFVLWGGCHQAVDEAPSFMRADL
ncbi:hypothetical protein M885DRAFT_512828 [Pelagophyceae sp. CCMP2097]|nr:hypothetical protein M885DRAFT_512828 [Pelagophyceae sp. CCMP2097]